MTNPIGLATRPLRAALRDELLRQLLAGDIAAGARLNETELARRMGVSQTPVREALLSLEGTGLIRAEPRRGFRVQPLTLAEATELYTLAGHLERWALTVRGVPDRATLDRLDEINERLITSSADFTRSLALDLEWHTLLLAHVGSSHLTDMLSRLKQAIERYEHAYFRATENAITATSQHARIAAALRRGALERAAELLEKNWLVGIPAMTKWLAEPGRGAPKEGAR